MFMSFLIAALFSQASMLLASRKKYITASVMAIASMAVSVPAGLALWLM